jgi:ribosomal protein L7/L12
MELAFWLVVALGCLWATTHSIESRMNAARLERKLDLILKHLNLDPNEEVKSEVTELRDAGKKFQAMKLYRLRSGAGLRDAKKYVEGL